MTFHFLPTNRHIKACCNQLESKLCLFMMIELMTTNYVAGIVVGDLCIGFQCFNFMLCLDLLQHKYLFNKI
ncbi:CLUMA_CG012913, isoform A [Clunio marinus]|uniref:CLUMA_CG012913, isoform A n=1 Tax=Clunio marinus TaxID=568069 RepID=A0A1J1IMA5_9DIPT|nr:CLUMA_CG012913, isoform A [Clunio marinus]